MTIDFYHSNFVIFDGTSYLPTTDTIFGKNVIDNSLCINIFVGIIHFSSKNTYTTKKSGVIRKECSSFIRYFPQILAKTKKINQQIDMYAVLKIENVQDGMIYCDVLEYLGEIGDSNVENNFIKITCTAHWNKTKALTDGYMRLCEIDLTPERKRYTTEIYTIDPFGCVDIDDALHSKRIYKNDILIGYEIGIHIADVSSFIVEDSIYDNELKNRIETVYLPKDQKPIHMIPEELSVQHISLRENVDRRGFSVILNLDIGMNILSVYFEKTLIYVTKNLTYEEAYEILLSQKNLCISDMYTIGKHLKQNIILSFDNEIYDIHQMVAVYMIYANKLVGEKIQLYDSRNALLRTHHKKNNESSVSLDTEIDKILLKKYSVNLVEQARYQLGTLNCFHYGLNLEYYTHFTSPIRRYADILVHRLLWKVLSNIAIDRLNPSIIFKMNFYMKFYKQIERYSRIIEIARNINTQCDIITDAYIIYISDTYDMIRLYIPQYELDYDYYLIHPKLKHIITVNSENNYQRICISNNHTNTNICLTLFQKISIRLTLSNQHQTKLKVQFVSDTVNDIFYLE